MTSLGKPASGARITERKYRHFWHGNQGDPGDDDDNFGLKTAKAGQVKGLLIQAGVSDPFAGLPEEVIPFHLQTEVRSVEDAINRLVELRGEIVHTGKVPDTLRKRHLMEWRQFAENVVVSPED